MNDFGVTWDEDPASVGLIVQVEMFCVALSNRVKMRNTTWVRAWFFFHGPRISKIGRCSFLFVPQENAVRHWESSSLAFSELRTLGVDL